MATILSQWEQAAQYDPMNPLQKTYVYYTGIPGGYGSFYYNQVPTTAQLNGLGDTSIPDWVSALLVGLVGVGAGYFGLKTAYPWARKHLGLSGHRRRR